MVVYQIIFNKSIIVCIFVLIILFEKLLFNPAWSGLGGVSMVAQHHPVCSPLRVGINSLSIKHKYVKKLNTSSLLTNDSSGIVFIIGGHGPISSTISRCRPCHAVSPCSIVPPTKPHVPAFLPYDFCKNKKRLVDFA